MCTCVAHKWSVYVIAAVARRDDEQRIYIHQSKIGNLKGIFSERLSAKFTRSVIIFFYW